jgi:hypothetical protein
MKKEPKAIPSAPKKLGGIARKIDLWRAADVNISRPSFGRRDAMIDQRATNVS